MIRIWMAAFSVVIATACEQLLFDAPIAPTLCSVDTPFAVKRFDTNPIFNIAQDDFLNGNVNGPSVIRVPEWAEGRLGDYYLYFAHHGGDTIKMAYADDIEGPWTYYEPGVLSLDAAKMFVNHIASPDVHVDHENQRIVMYYHGVTGTEDKFINQRTDVALSPDGLSFKPRNEDQGWFYFRVFEHNGWFYALEKDWTWTNGHRLLRSATGIGGWEPGQLILPKARHTAFDLGDNAVTIYYSTVTDAPERIKRVVMSLNGDWTTWTPGSEEEVLRPKMEYEGTDYPVQPSKTGRAINVNELRDPFLFTDKSGAKYLFYSGGGESTLNAARMTCDY